VTSNACESELDKTQYVSQPAKSHASNNCAVKMAVRASVLSWLLRGGRVGGWEEFCVGAVDEIGRGCLARRCKRRSSQQWGEGEHIVSTCTCSR